MKFNSKRDDLFFFLTKAARQTSQSLFCLLTAFSAVERKREDLVPVQSGSLLRKKQTNKLCYSERWVTKLIGSVLIQNEQGIKKHFCNI